MVLMVVVFWSSTATLAGQHPGSVAADLLLSVLLTGQALRAAARRADAEAEVLSRRMAAQDAALAAEEAERRAANAVHDDVLSVLRAVSLAGRSVPWNVVVDKARGAINALARQVLRGGYG